MPADAYSIAIDRSAVFARGASNAAPTLAAAQ
jgi:hypothetical protein